MFLANDIQERGITFMPQHRGQGDFPLHNGDGFKVVYHKDLSRLAQQDYALPDVDFAIWQSDLPTHPRALGLAPPVMQLRPEFHWQNAQLVQQLEALPEMDADYEGVWDLLTREIWADGGVMAPYLGGYHTPFQNDQRRFFEDYRKYDRCLLSFGAFPGIDIGDLSLSILIEDACLEAADFGDVVAIADAD